MSRYKKLGLDYFPVNVDIDTDDKFQIIEAEHGLEAFAVIIKLMAKIYKEHGYYYPWTEREAKLFECKHHVDMQRLNVYMMSTFKEGIFDSEIHKSFGVLTSRGIQSRYFDAVKRRNDVYVYSEIILANKPSYVKYHSESMPIYGDLCIHDANMMSTSVHREEKRKSRVDKRKIYIGEKVTIIDHLNALTGSRYKPHTRQTSELIDDRLNDGYSVDDCLKVIDKKVDEWKGTDYERYLTPKTLFGDKFEIYHNQKIITGTKSNFKERDIPDEEFEQLNKELVNHKKPD